MQDDMRNRLAKITIKKKKKKRKAEQDNLASYLKENSNDTCIFLYFAVFFFNNKKKPATKPSYLFFPHVILNDIFRLDDPLHYTKLSINP